MDVDKEIQKTCPPRIWSLTSVILVAAVFISVYIFMVFVDVIAMEVFGRFSFEVHALSFLAGIIAEVLAIVVGRNIGQFSWEDFGFCRTESRWYWIALVIAPCLVILRILVANFLVVRFPHLSIGLDSFDNILFCARNPFQRSIGIFLIGCAVPISEEMFFRGYVYDALRMKLPAWFSILIGSAIFAAIHLVPLQIITVFILALVLAWLYEKSNSLVPCIILHIANNIIAIILTLARF